MKYTFTTPLSVGDPLSPILVDAMELASCSMNFDIFYTDQGKAVLSIGMVHRASGYKINFLYAGSQGLDFWNSCKPLIEQSIWTKIMNDADDSGKKLPAGVLA